MCRHVRHYHTQFSLLRWHTMWGNHLNSCRRFQFSPVPCKTKSELRKRVCRSLKIAFYKRSRTSDRLIRRWVVRLASKTRDSFWCSDNVSYWFEPVDGAIKEQSSMTASVTSDLSRNTYDSLPTRGQLHLTRWIVDVSIRSADRTVLRRAVTVDWARFSDHRASGTGPHVWQCERGFSNSALLHCHHAAVQIRAAISAANQVFFCRTPGERGETIHKNKISRND